MTPNIEHLAGTAKLRSSVVGSTAADVAQMERVVGEASDEGASGDGRRSSPGVQRRRWNFGEFFVEKDGGMKLEGGLVGIWVLRKGDQSRAARGTRETKLDGRSRQLEAKFVIW